MVPGDRVRVTGHWARGYVEQETTLIRKTSEGWVVSLKTSIPGGSESSLWVVPEANLELVRSHVDDQGRPMSDPVAITMSRSDWHLARNQIRNMADLWRKQSYDRSIAARCDDIADLIDLQLHDTEPSADQVDVTSNSGAQGYLSAKQEEDQ